MDWNIISLYYYGLFLLLVSATSKIYTAIVHELVYIQQCMLISFYIIPSSDRVLMFVCWLLSQIAFYTFLNSFRVQSHTLREPVSTRPIVYTVKLCNKFSLSYLNISIWSSWFIFLRIFNVICCMIILVL